MARFALEVAYDGTEFHGWQRQPGRRTVQGALEEAVRRALGGQALGMEGAGRTDAGVHARGQVVSFGVETRVPARALPATLNAALPREVRVVSAREVGLQFHARRSATGRRYAYRLLEREDPLLGRFALRPRGPCSLDGLVRATRPLEGRHDCSSFRAGGGSDTHPWCRVWRASWSRWEGGLRFDVIADRFLYRMVRRIVGTALALCRETDPAAAMAAVLAARDRSRAGPTAPAHGLTLEQVYYRQGEGP